MVLGTDGRWEACDLSGTMYGKERLFGVLRRNGGLSAAQIAAAVLDDLRAFKGPVEFEDDATLAVVTWVPTGRVAG